MFESLTHLTSDEFYAFFDSRGIDGGSKFAKILPSLDHSIKRIVKFAKVLPGFIDLPVADQISLIKGVYYRHN